MPALLSGAQRLSPIRCYHARVAFLLAAGAMTGALQSEPRGFLNNLSIELGAGIGGLLGDGFDADPTVAYGVRVSSFVSRSIYVFVQDSWAYSHIFFDFVRPSTGLPEEDDEHITVHNLAAGAGLAWTVARDLELFGQLGVGRWIVGGTDHVRGHVTARVDAGLRWRFAGAWELSLDAGWTVGRAEFDVELFDGEIRGAWSALACVRLTLGARGS